MGRLPADPPDRILATSMVDLATLRGLNPHIAHVPACYYFHENQSACPPSHRQVACIEPQMVQLYGALAAQCILFNSAYNRDSFADGVVALLRRMPDAVPEGIARDLAARAEVLPIPIPDIRSASKPEPRLIVWNHRWEYDKAPLTFVLALTGLAHDGADFRLAMLGRRPADAPASLRRLRREMGARIVVDAELDTAA